MVRVIFIIGIFALCSLTALAQRPDTARAKSRQDSLIQARDSVSSKRFAPNISKLKKYHPDSTHSPGLAFRRSGYIPGWGQLYNHQWWKVPIIYTGLGLLGAAVEFNHRYYKQYLTVYNLRRNGATKEEIEAKGETIKTLFYNTQNVDITAIENAQSGYQRNMQLSILGIAGAWGIQMIDAYIQAKFIHSYSMDPDISFRISPGVLTQPVYASTSLMPVVKLTFTFK